MGRIIGNRNESKRLQKDSGRSFMMRRTMSQIKKLSLCLILLIAIPTCVLAEDYPTKPVNVVVSLAPGAPVDIIIRILANKVEKRLGQPFVISNNGAGGGSTAAQVVATSKTDGYHLMGCGSTVLVRLPQFRTVPYKLDDFVPLFTFGAPQTMLVVKADSPWKTHKEFIDYAKKNPGKVTYTTIGVGSPHHIAMEYIAKQEGIKWTMIPYTIGDATIPLLGGHVTATVATTTCYPLVRAGKLRMLAVHGEKRVKAFPNVPTLLELGYDHFNDSVFLMAAPRGTPPAIVKKLNDAFHEAMSDPEFLQAMEKTEVEFSYRNSEDTKKYLEKANVTLGKLIRELKIPREEEKKK